MFNLAVVALLITVVIWMVITTVLFVELQKQVVALKDLETNVINAQNNDLKETIKQLSVLSKILEFIGDDVQDSYEVMKKVIQESNENKTFAIKTVLRAQEVLKKCNAIRNEIVALNNSNFEERANDDRERKES